MKKVLYIILFYSLILSITGCVSKSDQPDPGAMGLMSVATVEVTPLKIQKIAQKIDLSATLKGYETKNIAPSVSGNIEHIYVDIGSRINPGDTLVRMDQNQYKTTKLAYTNLSIEYERIRELYETETVSQQTYDQTELSYKQTKENLSFLTQNTFVKADMPGVITAKNYEDGELFSGNPILTLTQIRHLKAIISIPETYFPLVEEGMKLNIRSDIYPEQTFPAIIEIVYPIIDEATHTFKARLKIPNQAELLRPGMFIRTTLELGEINAFMVPYQSVLRLTGSNERYVFINETGVARRISVSLGQRYDEMVEIVSDKLTSGDLLVTVGQEKLIDGMKMNVVE